MSNFLGGIVIMIVFALLSMEAKAIEYDAETFLKNALREVGLVHTKNINNRWCVKEEKTCVAMDYSSEFPTCLGYRSDCVKHQSSTTHHREYLLPFDITGTLISEKYGPVELAGVPDRLHVATTEVTNCSSRHQNSSESLSKASSLSRTLAIATQISKAKMSQINISASFQGFGGGAGLSFTETYSIGSNDSKTVSDQVNYTQSFSRSVSPKTRLITKFVVVERTFRIPYSAIVELDSKVTPNLQGPEKSSDLISPLKRQIPISGYIDADLGSKGKIHYEEQELSDEECQFFSLEDLENKFGERSFLTSLEEGFDAEDGSISELLPTVDEFAVFGGSVFSAEGGSDSDSATADSVASGTHMCQSRDSIGHSCKVFTTSSGDCRQAQIDLKSDNCCSRTPYGGNSIGFSLDFCSSF